MYIKVMAIMMLIMHPTVRDNATVKDDEEKGEGSERCASASGSDIWYSGKIAV